VREFAATWIPKVASASSTGRLRAPRAPGDRRSRAHRRPGVPPGRPVPQARDRPRADLARWAIVVSVHVVNTKIKRWLKLVTVVQSGQQGDSQRADQRCAVPGGSVGTSTPDQHERQSSLRPERDVAQVIAAMVRGRRSRGSLGSSPGLTAAHRVRWATSRVR
jgi:hypothetical protein